MDVNELTIGEAREIARAFNTGGCTAFPFKIGTNLFIRTVTHITTGRLVDVTATELVVEDAAWVADTGRYADALASGTLSEVEPYPAGRVAVGRMAIVDCCEWSHKLPREQK